MRVFILLLPLTFFISSVSAQSGGNTAVVAYHLLFFLNLSTSFMTSLGAPLAFLCAFIAMDYMDLSLNLISMFGLILVLGMLVDDAIIVAEQYYQKLEKGISPKEAAREAAIETIRPVTATVLTTMIAFGSLLWLGMRYQLDLKIAVHGA